MNTPSTQAQFVGVPKPEEQSRREHHSSMAMSEAQNQAPNKDRLTHAKNVLADAGHMDCPSPSY